MRRIIVLACLLFSLPAFSALATDVQPFQLIYRQENVASDKINTKSDLYITIINLSGGEARDIVLSIPGPNPFLFVDSPVPVTTIPADRQAEILRKTDMPNDMIALADPEEKLVWQIEFTDESGARSSVEVHGMNGK